MFAIMIKKYQFRINRKAKHDVMFLIWVWVFISFEHALFQVIV
jgi:hypothetical protein